MKLRCDPRQVQTAVAVLNEALTQDRRAMQYLLDKREICNERLEKNDTIQVSEDSEGNRRVGVLGVVNGILGTLPDGSGPIAAVYDDNGYLVEFIRRS